MSSIKTTSALSTYGPCEAVFDSTNEELVFVAQSTQIQRIDVQSMEVMDRETIDDEEVDFQNCIAIHPGDHYLLVGTEDNSVARVHYPGGELEGIMIRMTSAIRQISIDGTGTYAAIAADETEVKICSLVDKSVFSLIGSSGPAKSVAFDPLGVFVASSSCDRTLRIWDITQLAKANPIFSFPGLAKTNPDSENLLRISWSSDGSYLAIPKEKDIAILCRHSWKVECVLSSEHLRDVSIISWSPNGLYLAAADMQNKVLIWEFKRRSVLARLDVEKPISSISWSRKHNMLAFSTFLGNLTKWLNPIPDHLVSPITSLEPNSRRFGSLREESTSPDPSRRKKLKKTAQLQDEEEINNEGIVYSEDDLENVDKDFDIQVGEPVDPNFVSDDEDSFYHDRDFSSKVIDVRDHVQDSFHSGSTPSVQGRRLLCWNLVGTIESQETETHNIISIQFSDVGSHRPLRFNDRFGYSMASMSSKGVVFASPSRSSEGGPTSTVFFKLFDCWSTNDEWRVSLPEKEDAVCVSVGKKWCAVATTRNNLRLFSMGGLQRLILTLPGRPICSTASDDCLYVVYQNASVISSSADQNLGYCLWSIEKKDCLSRGRVSLSPGSSLVWIGFVEGTNTVATCDSAGVFRCLFLSWGHQWVPVLDAQEMWPVGLTEDSLMYIKLRPGSKYPNLSPRPGLSITKLQVPLIQTQNAEALRLEQDLLLQSMQDFDRESSSRISLKKKARLDKLTIKLIQAACQEDNQFRALDLCTTLHMPKSLSIAIKVADYFRMHLLSQKMNLLLNSKFSSSQESERCESTDVINHAPLQPETPKHDEKIVEKEQIVDSDQPSEGVSYVPKPLQARGPSSSVRPSFAEQLQNKRARAS